MDENHPHYNPHMDYYYSTKHELPKIGLEVRKDVDWDSVINQWHKKSWAVDFMKLLFATGAHSVETEVTINYPLEKGP